MPNDNLQMLARVKALALAAMIEAGGKPCWVAARTPSTDSTPASGGDGLTDREAAMLASYSPSERARIGRLLDRLPAPAPVAAPRAAISPPRPPVDTVRRPAPAKTRRRATFAERF